MEQKHISGYTGYIPGEKWQFGTKGNADPQPTARLRARSAGNGSRPASRARSAMVQRQHTEIYRGEETATQFPVQTLDEASQAEFVDTAAFVEDAQGRPPSRGTAARRQSAGNVRRGRAGVDGRVVNNHAPQVLFMNDDPFRGLNGSDYTGKRGRYYDQQANSGGNQQNNSFIPTPGYTGYIPGMSTSIGKPYGVIMRELKGIDA